MSINKFTVSILSVVFLLVCSAVMIGANYESQTEWEYASFEKERNKYAKSKIVNLPDTIISLVVWQPELGLDQSKSADYAVRNGEAIVVEGNYVVDDLNYLEVFKGELNKSLNLEEKSIGNASFDFAVMNALGKAGYEMISRYVENENVDTVVDEVAYKIIFKRKVR